MNFCEVTGQPNWCDDYMQCDGKRGLCPVQHWCVCEWAFASYITCDKIQSIDCEATNRWAYRHYQQKGASEALAHGTSSKMGGKRLSKVKAGWNGN